MTDGSTTIADILTVEQIAERLNLSAQTIQKKCRTRELPAKKRCGRWFVLQSDLLDWIQSAEN